MTGSESRTPSETRLRKMPGLARAGLDIFWLKDESLEDSDNLPEPEVLAA